MKGEEEAPRKRRKEGRKEGKEEGRKEDRLPLTDLSVNVGLPGIQKRLAEGKKVPKRISVEEEPAEEEPAEEVSFGSVCSNHTGVDIFVQV